MPEIQRILCAVDFSDESRHAIDHAVVIARWYKASIVALHVYNPVFLHVPALPTVGYRGDPVPDEDELRRLREDTGASFSSARADGIDVEVLLETGPPAARIIDSAASLGADLIVVGTHGHGGFEHLMLGSVTEKVLRKAACPVLTVPPRARRTSNLPFKRMLCPVDFSDSSLGALRSAFSLAKEGDAELTILHVLEWPSDEEPLTTRPFNVPEYHLYREKDATTRLKTLMPEGAQDWCKPATRLAHGKPYREILGIAAEDSVDLIVMGVQGRSALDVMLFGSTTNQVVRRATCPVLTMRR